MRRFAGRGIVVVFLMWLVVAGLTSRAAKAAPAGEPDAGMMAADHAFVDAVAKSDKKAMEKLLDKDFRWTDYKGKTESRTEILLNPLKSAISGEASSKAYTYGELGDVQENAERAHVLRVWAKRPDGWKIVVYQEVMSLEAPPTTAPGAGKDCQNPCKGTPFKPKDATQQAVINAYSKLESGAFVRNATVFAAMTADEFVAASSNSNKIYDKPSRIEDFNHSKNGGVAPTPLTSGKMTEFGDAVLMVTEHTPDKGKPLHVTRIWVKRSGNWVTTLSYQTAVQSLGGGAKPQG
jgi:hypothetical protein